jgi:hypothetical protein
VETFVRDIRYSLRMVRNNPGFPLIVMRNAARQTCFTGECNRYGHVRRSFDIAPGGGVARLLATGTTSK